MGAFASGAFLNNFHCSICRLKIRILASFADIIAKKQKVTEQRNKIGLGFHIFSLFLIPTHNLFLTIFLTLTFFLILIHISLSLSFSLLKILIKQNQYLKKSALLQQKVKTFPLFLFCLILA